MEPYLQTKQVFLRKSEKKNAQVELYNRWLPEAKKFDWVIVVDLDEFIYARNGFKTIKDYLGTIDKDIYKIRIPWKLFGSSGLKKQPNSVIQHFVHRRKFPESGTQLGCHTFHRFTPMFPRQQRLQGCYFYIDRRIFVGNSFPPSKSLSYSIVGIL